MGRASNTLKGSDVTTTPVRLKYSQSYSSNTMDNYGISVYNGINTPVDADGNFTQEFLNYASAKQLYYNSYITGSILGSGSGYNDNLQSTAASGTFDNDFRKFPTAVSSSIATLSIPMSAFGERMARGSFNITFTNYGYHLIDDSNGNIIDIDNSNEHVGNILYAQGMVVITNATYVPAFTPIYNDFNFYINNTVNVSGSIVADIRMTGYNRFNTTGGPSVYTILPGFNTYDLNYASGTFPTEIRFNGLYNSSTASFGGPRAAAIIFDNVYPIGSGPDPIKESRNYAWNTAVDTLPFDTEPIFLPTNTGATPTLEVALVPIVRQCLSVVFNHFDTTLNPSARIVIYDAADPSSIFFDKTIANVVSDNTYAYLIQTPVYTNQQLIVDISDVTRVDGSSSTVRIFSRTNDTGGGPDSGIKYIVGLKNVTRSFNYPINYASVNIQLEYAS
jgi:hypothetical protein